MRKRHRTHTTDEFGQPGSGSSTIGLDGPMIGAGAAIQLDGLVERESDKTPMPPPVRLKAVAIALIVMFVLGLAALGILSQVMPQEPNGGDRTPAAQP